MSPFPAARIARPKPLEERSPIALRVALGSHDNALNFIRLTLALLVIVWHVAPLTGLTAPAWVTVTDLGALAVNGFFVISGYLVLGSAMRSSSLHYAKRRALRIYPALWVNVIVIAFLLAPIAAWYLGTTWNGLAAVRYVVANGTSLPTIPGLHPGAGHLDLDTLRGQPLPAWNGSLWTLPHEITAYVAAGILVNFRITRRYPAAVCGALLGGTLVVQPFLSGPLSVTTNLYLEAVRLATFFLAGALLYAVSDRLVLRGYLAIGATFLVTVGLFALPHPWMWLPLPYAYALLYAGARLPVRVGSVNDLSYGVYIYAFPLQQVGLLLAGPTIGWWGHLLLTTLLTLGTAALSWHLIERPALRLGHRKPVARVPQPVT